MDLDWSAQSPHICTLFRPWQPGDGYDKAAMQEAALPNQVGQSVVIEQSGKSVSRETLFCFVKRRNMGLLLTL
jgi:hypothetical protein